MGATASIESVMEALSILRFPPNPTTEFAVSVLSSAIRDVVIVDMDSDDYIMTDGEAIAAGKVIINGVAGKTLYYPTSANSSIPVSQFVFSFSADAIDITLEAGGDSVTLPPAALSQIEVNGVYGVFLLADYYSDYSARLYRGTSTFTEDYEVAATDAGKNIVLDSSDPIVVSFTDANAASFLPNLRGYIMRLGAGSVTIEGDTGIQVAGNLTPAQNQIINWFYDEPNNTIYLG